MSISSIGGFNWATQTTVKNTAGQNLPTNTALDATSTDTDATQDSSSLASSLGSSKDVTQQFEDYVKETPAQRMQDTWLSQHGITQAQFNAMSSTDKQKIIDEMKQDIEAKIKQKLGIASTTSTNILV